MADSSFNAWEAIAASGPLALVLATGLYFTAKAYLDERKEKDQIQNTISGLIERKEQEKLAAIEKERREKTEEIQSLNAEVRELTRELIRRLESDKHE